MRPIMVLNDDHSPTPPVCQMSPTSWKTEERTLGRSPPPLALSLPGVYTMKGIWRCDAIIGGSRHSRLVLCRHWQVHNGNRGIPRRIDVTCQRCSTRHQHVPSPRDGRGRISRIFYERWPDDVDIDLIIEACSRRNSGGAPYDGKFVQATLL